ncbi:MAG: BMP family ABC transporter substrate-binding protein [Firmicutes bacterium]|jgi:basic membrane protein A|nr:BMP family ABC transporter substrate-binding protein [Bacillota bacterium]
MRKLIAFVLVIALAVVCLFGCTPAGDDKPQESKDPSKTDGVDPSGKKAGTASGLPALSLDDLKVGFLYNTTIGSEGYVYVHNLGRIALEEMGIETLYLENVPETSDCEKAARDLIEQGCNVIYAISFGHMEYIAKVAEDYPDIYFNHCTGYITKNNMSTYMGKIYQAQYLAGIAAGMRTETNKIGFVTTFPIPEVVRQVNAYTLGARSVNPEATVEVKWTSSWYDPATEKTAASELLNGGCDVIAAYCNSMNAQMAAAERGVWATGGTSPGGEAVVPDAFLTAANFDYAAFYVQDIQEILDGTWSSAEGFKWRGLDKGVVKLDTITKNCAPGTVEKIEEAKQGIIDGTLDMWKGVLKDNKGVVRIKEGETLTDQDLLAIDWFVEGVIGTVN